ncbi:UNKNOWN [Stylonychia lemnae]|uniref:Uncharacterized protein n=1 Tax=Stylonychia lemnae TaxID=5949 RepID=A0A078ALZ8_STYLE|nr:UNKNOWN [Stylonychia lemnae]|eukprot:CDW82886.1 UNKNOWN [Stylonychia lemnae]
MSGSLMPSVPTQFLLKFNPPKITIVYHFLRNENEKYYHEIPIERRLLESMSNDDMASHLFVSEAYYFDPKQIPRKQVVNIVQRLKDGYVQAQKQNQKNQPAQNQANNQFDHQEGENFFQKKRSLKFDDNYSDDFIEEPQFDLANSKKEDDSIKNPFVKNIAPSHSPQVQDMRSAPHTEEIFSQSPTQNQIYNQGNAYIQAPWNNNAQNKQSQQNTNNNLINFDDLEQSSIPFQMSPTDNQMNSQNEHHQNPQSFGTGVGQQNQNQYDDLLDMVDFESDHDDGAPNQNQSQQYRMDNNGQNIHLNDDNDYYVQQNDMLDGGDNNQVESGAQDVGEEEESVYIKDNIVMRRIQIEGEDQEYLMDPEGNIYDMQGNFIGTANANDLEEMEEDQEEGMEEKLVL